MYSLQIPVSQDTGVATLCAVVVQQVDSDSDPDKCVLVLERLN
jgi:hypothetical protein